MEEATPRNMVPSLPPISTRNVVIAVGCVCFTCVYSFFRGLKAVNFVPGMRPLFSPITLLGAVIPRTWWNPGHNWVWDERRNSFFNYTHDIISIVPVIYGKPCFYTCSVDVLRQLLGNENKTHLTKPQEITLASVTGDNVASVNGEVWRRHRRVVGPAFNTKTFSLVREQTSELYREVVQSEGWNKQDVVFLPSVNEFMLKYALIIVARCAFGLDMAWGTSTTSSTHDMDLGEAISVVTSRIFYKLILPSWAFRLPIKSIRHVGTAWSTFVNIVKESIHARKDILADESEDATADVLGCLVQSFQFGGKYKLSEEEVMADIFTILFAGHETTASVLSATMICLALYQDEQQKAYEEIKGAFSADRLTINDSNQLPHLQACFQECGRMYPAAFMVAREMTEDVPVKVMHPKEATIVLPKGSQIIMELIGVHHNPNVYSNPERFCPSRWYGVSEPDLPMFGFGPRACVGRKFSHTEAVTFLAHLLYDWELHVDFREGESVQDYEKRVLGNARMIGTAFSISPVSLRMKRRS